MKRHMLEVLLFVFSGAFCVYGDTYLKCQKECSAACDTCLAKADSTYNDAKAASQKIYDHCIDQFYTQQEGLGTCYAKAGKDHCPGDTCDDGYMAALRACDVKWTGSDGQCLKAQKESNDTAGVALTAIQSACTEAISGCGSLCPLSGQCGDNTDCQGSNYNSATDRGPLCDTGATPPVLRSPMHQ